ncbi:hypothetical protein QQZ08_003715 [Neonectria magnoliae]|uniref:PD-(D/E)XK nuclease-like domain-containing protein n=1 Tax=Neonectria magnoliae TaxID=2732573 RepID=A0ABR1I8Y5_9HYPO
MRLREQTSSCDTRFKHLSKAASPTPSHTRTLRNKESQQRNVNSTGSPEKRPNDETSKASRGNKRARTPRSESSYSLTPSQSQYYTSTRSGQSSPLRDLAALERDEQGLKPRELSAFHPQPPSLEALLEQMEVFAYAEGILPASARDTLEILDAAVYWDMKWATQGPRSTRHYSTEREALGCMPSPDSVRKLVSEAAECSANSHPEANWNIAVHSRILDLAFDAPDHQARLVKSMGSSTASIIQEYHRSATRTKKVDFYIYLELPKMSLIPRRNLTWTTFPTLFAVEPLTTQTFILRLRNRPIALSIETNKPGESWEKVKLQLGIWESAR